MKIDILSLFPNSFAPLRESILKRATDKNFIQINVIDIRSFSSDSHHKCDDYSYGGGNGMIMTCQPIFDAIQSIKCANSYCIYLSPKGNVLNQNKVKQLAKYEHLILLCGHYEGIDERIIELCVDEEISIGDYVLTGGELPAMVLTDCVARYVDGVLGNSESVVDESFSNNELEYPQYTRPEEFMGLRVPDVLISGNHQNISKWRKEQSRIITKKRRPDLGEK